MRKTSSCDKTYGAVEGYCIFAYCMLLFSKLPSDLLHSTASDTSDFLHTVVQKSCEAF